MPFVCTLDTSDELFVDVIEANGEYIVRVAVGFDSDTNETFSLAVALSPLPGGSMELTFSIVSYCHNDDSWTDYWDGEKTRSFVNSPADRQLIRSAVMTCVSALIDQVRPATVSMTTHTANLPQSAMAKFWEVNGIFANKGYDVGRADVFRGRYIWMMRRKSPI